MARRRFAISGSLSALPPVRRTPHLACAAAEQRPRQSAATREFRHAQSALSPR
jgi:hypothetical protein